jgi:ligand-binding SRPBCC domain-containing protein
MSRTYRIRETQLLPVTLEQAWNYFSNPDNLQHITPPALGFRVTSEPHGHHIYPGQIIEYKIRPVLGIPLYWMTEITHVENQRFFVDEQRYGPYSLWHHQHHFRETEGGVEMTDIVHYRIPLGWLGDLANTVFVGRQLKELFRYRTEIIPSRLNGSSLT